MNALTVPNEKITPQITPQFFASGGGLAEQIAVKLVHGSRTVPGVIGIWGSRSPPIPVRYDAR